MSIDREQLLVDFARQVHPRIAAFAEACAAVPIDVSEVATAAHTLADVLSAWRSCGVGLVDLVGVALPPVVWASMRGMVWDAVAVLNQTAATQAEREVRDNLTTLKKLMGSTPVDLN